MTVLAYRTLRPTPAAEATYLAWLERLDAFFTEHQDVDSRSELVRDELHRIFYGQTPAQPDNIGWLSLDPRNITLEPEYYGDVDAEKYAVRKPLIWLWQMFDHSPAGQNHWLGFRLRAMLGTHLFKHIGQNVKIFHNVEFTYGYNLTIEDGCTIHRHVLLDDRGELILHQGTSVSDYANIYSHTHDVNLQADVTNKLTEIGPRARITYHATVLAGSSIGEDGMLGALGLATKPVPPEAIALGIPAQVKRMKTSRELKK